MKIELITGINFFSEGDTICDIWDKCPTINNRRISCKLCNLIFNTNREITEGEYNDIMEKLEGEVE